MWDFISIDSGRMFWTVNKLYCSNNEWTYKWLMEDNATKLLSIVLRVQMDPNQLLGGIKVFSVGSC